MDWLNYHHLLYFWMVVRTGSIARASQELRLAPPTISAQIRRLEASLGEKLLLRSGRRLIPTEVGTVVFRYAEEIFTLGREMQDTVRGRLSSGPLRLRVGVADVLPKLVAFRLLEPALHLPVAVRPICLEDPLERLLPQLAMHELDVVLSDAPGGPGLGIRAFNHLLADSAVAFYAAKKLAARYRRGFPHSLEGAPFLLPTADATLRRELDQWLDDEGLRPVRAGEFEDAALMMVFGAAGFGIFAGPANLARRICEQYHVARIGQSEKVRVRYFAITVERKLNHPAVIAICSSARPGSAE